MPMPGQGLGIAYVTIQSLQTNCYSPLPFDLTQGVCTIVCTIISPQLMRYVDVMIIDLVSFVLHM
jgi:hypothetical protein